MNERNQIIERYFNAWLKKDSLVLEDVFSPLAIYRESYGPAYQGIADIRKWFV